MGSEQLHFLSLTILKFHINFNSGLCNIVKIIKFFRKGKKLAKITIFGLAGTGTTSVGKALAKRLGYKFLSSGDIFRQKAIDLGIEFYKFEKLCRGNPKHDLELDEYVGKFGKKIRTLLLKVGLLITLSLIQLK